MFRRSTFHHSLSSVYATICGSDIQAFAGHKQATPSQAFVVQAQSISLSASSMSFWPQSYYPVTGCDLEKPVYLDTQRTALNSTQSLAYLQRCLFARGL
jgi:hypothetical protein